MSFQILLEASTTGRAPRKGPRGQLSFCMLFFLAHSQPWTLPCCIPSALFHLLLRLLLTSSFLLSRWLKTVFFPHLFFPLFCFLSLLLLINVEGIDFPTTELQLSQDYRLQGAREALHSQRTQIYPTHSAVMPGNQVKFFFSSPKEGAQPMQCAHAAPKQDRLHLFQVCGFGVNHNLTFTPDIKVFKADMDKHQ